MTVFDRNYRTSTGDVLVHDQGANLTQWRVGESPVIWVSAQTAYAEGRAIRGGVPICWPWFGPGRTPGLEPAHGFARLVPWQLVRDESVDGQSAHLAWELTHRDVAGHPGVEHFPHAFTAHLEVLVTDTATISLTVRNDDSHSFDYEAALHTYLHVGDSRRVRITGLDDTDYFDKVAQREEHQSGDLHLVGETDRVYRCPGPVQVHDPALNRILLIEKVGSPDTVVWNPGPDKAASMTDFGDDEWPEMVCVEAGAVLGNAVTLEPGAEHRLCTTISVLPADAS